MTGRSGCWFANSWIGDRSGEIHDWSSGVVDEAAELASLIARMHATTDLCVAIILSPKVSELALSVHVPILLAGHRDLLLEAAETAGFLQEKYSLNPNASRRIHALGGGWLRALQILVADPGDHDGARQAIRGVLAVWLEQQDQLMALCDAAYLTIFDAPTVESFYGEFSSEVHTLHELINAGFLHSDGNGGWVMPSLLCEVLTEFAGRLGPARTAILEQAAAHATVLNGGILQALDSALMRRSWSSMQDLLLNYWTDLFITDPRKLGAMAAKVPRFIADQTVYTGVGLRILGMAGKEGMELQLPTLAPDLASDHLAQRLRRDTERLYLKPNARALTLGMAEQAHLRLSGHFQEAGNAALRWRRTQLAEVCNERIKPNMAAFATLQAGISFHLAGRVIEAKQSYEVAYHLAKASGSAFLLADAAGKLSLLNAFEGTRESALHWVK